MGGSDTTMREAGPPAPESRAARLHLMGPGRFETRPLPASGSWVIGRGEGCEIVLDAPAVSRRHAVLHLGPQIRLEDAGSANGTSVRGQRLAGGQSVLIAPGDPIEIGEFTLTVALEGGASREARLWPHAYFEACLEGETKRPGLGVLEVVRLRIDPVPELLASVLTADLRADELAAEFGPHEYELLLIERSPEIAATVARDLADRLRAVGAREVKIGSARWPRDGRSAGELISKATESVRGGTAASLGPGGIVVEDPAMVKLHRLIERVASGSISVLILGETGTGKEVIAEAIHDKSPRAERELVRLNCAALSESLIESELFGHEKGAFTGALKAKPGLVETADGGTLFLDEVGELPPSIQVKLLRVLEQRQVLRVGGLKPIDVDVRLIAATNRDLQAEVEAGRFRQDLYFRLNGISLTVPPLRERLGEIVSLAKLFIREICGRDRLPVPELSLEALEVLRRHRWPGNVRELRNVIERAVLLSGGEPIGAQHLPLERMAAPRSAPSEEVTAEPAASVGKLTDEMRVFERDRIVKALDACGGNQTRAAQMLGIARRTLINRLEEYGIERPRKKARPEEED